MYVLWNIFQQDEWIVCRVFQKSNAGGKRYSTNNNTLRIHVNPYTTLDQINPNTICISSQIMMPQVEHNTFQLAMGKSSSSSSSAHTVINHPDIQEVFRGVSSSNLMNLHPTLQSQMNNNLGGGNGFTISGLNFNLGGATTSQPGPPPPRPRQDVSSSHVMMTAHDDQAGYGEDMSSGNVMNRFMVLENSSHDLDNCWGMIYVVRILQKIAYQTL